MKSLPSLKHLQNTLITFCIPVGISCDASPASRWWVSASRAGLMTANDCLRWQDRCYPPHTTTTLPQSPAVIIIITVLLLISPHRHPFKCLPDERLLWFQAFMPKWCDGWIFSGSFFSLSFSYCFTEMGVRRMRPHVLVSLTYLPASWVSVCVCMCEHARWWGTNWKWDGLHIFFPSLSPCVDVCVFCVCV